jgi:hypothetical protein
MKPVDDLRDNTASLLPVIECTWGLDVRQTEMHTAEPLVPDPSPFEVKISIAKLKRYKLPGTDQILAELIQAWGETLWCEILKIINPIWNKEELSD